MAIAVMSDFHANLEASEAVFRDRDQLNKQGRRIDKTYCLGDLVDYGANPREVIEIVRRECDLVLSGNHDEDVTGKDRMPVYRGREVVFVPLPYNVRRPTLAVFGVRRQLAMERFWNGLVNLAGKDDYRIRPEKTTGNEFLNYLRALLQIHREGDLTFVHGAPIENMYTSLYFRYSDVEDLANLVGIKPDVVYSEAFGNIGKLCFVGHTHVPAITRLLQHEDLICSDNVDGEKRIAIKDLGDKAVINVGSVGQPRDGDPRACYAILDDDGVEFRRVEYDFSKAAKKIRDSGVGEKFVNMVLHGRSKIDPKTS